MERDASTRTKVTVKPDDIQTRDVSRRSFLRAAGLLAAMGGVAASCELLVSDLKDTDSSRNDPSGDAADAAVNDQGRLHRHPYDAQFGSWDGADWTVYHTDADNATNDAIEADSDRFVNDYRDFD